MVRKGCVDGASDGASGDAKRPQRTACVDLPAFPLQLLLREHPDWRDEPAAVVDKDKPQGFLLWINERAREAGILPGMRYAAGLSLIRTLRAGVVDGAAVETALEEVRARLRGYTPEVETDPGEPGVFFLGAAGLSLLHQSLEQWAEFVRADLAARGFEARVAVASSRFGAYALAKASRRGVLVLENASAEKRLLREIPLARLSLDAGIRDTLALLGIERLGGFIDLPPEEVKRRFPPEFAAFHRLARGERYAPLLPETPEEPLERRAILDYPETDVARLSAVVEELLRSHLCALHARGRALTSVRLRLDLDGASPLREEIPTAEPTLDQKQILELIRLRLEATPLPAGVIDLRLDSVWTKATAEQLQLFAAKPRRDLRAAERALAAVRAELGGEAVVQAKLRDAHLPEARFEWERFGRLAPPAARRVHWPPLIRRIFSASHPLPARPRYEPDGWLVLGLNSGRVVERVGPYVVSGGWWRRAVQREYHYARTESGRWLWIYFDRERRRWMWQGEVG